MTTSQFVFTLALELLAVGILIIGLISAAIWAVDLLIEWIGRRR